MQAARAALMPAVLTRLVQNTWSSSRDPRLVYFVTKKVWRTLPLTKGMHQQVKTVFTEWSFWATTD